MIKSGTKRDPKLRRKSPYTDIQVEREVALFNWTVGSRKMVYEKLGEKNRKNIEISTDLSTFHDTKSKILNRWDSLQRADAVDGSTA